MTEKKNKDSGEISRREFLKDAGLVVGSAAIGSTVLLAACGGEDTTETVTMTSTVTSTAPGGTETVTSTAPGGTVTSTATTTKEISKFVCPIDGMEFDTLEELQAHFEAAHGGEAAPEGLTKISLTVNGEVYTPVVDNSWDLQYLLHDVLGFIDIKTFCYRGACGSCTVIMDGRPILSCMTLATDADGHVIETAQGIAMGQHPLVDAYIKNHCMQCGYCTPGFILTAKALLDRNPDPSDEEIIEALSGNLCRCGTYPQHIIAIKEAAGVMKGGS